MASGLGQYLGAKMGVLRGGRIALTGADPLREIAPLAKTHRRCAHTKCASCGVMCLRVSCVLQWCVVCLRMVWCYVVCALGCGLSGQISCRCSVRQAERRRLDLRAQQKRNLTRDQGDDVCVWWWWEVSVTNVVLGERR